MATPKKKAAVKKVAVKSVGNAPVKAAVEQTKPDPKPTVRVPATTDATKAVAQTKFGVPPKKRAPANRF